MRSSSALSSSSLAAAYEGIVCPAHSWAPSYELTLGPIVADLCAAVNYAPDPEQRLGLDLTFGRTAAGKSAAFSVCVICCRQNMKTGLFKQVALGWLFVTYERLTVWSAHEEGTARESFRDLVDLIDSSPLLTKRLAPNGVKRGSSERSIETVNLRTGQTSRMLFKTRTGGGGRGLSGRKVILDEAFALRAEHMGALLPLMSAQPDPQVLYGSSAAKPDSSVEHGLVERGRKGVGDRFAYLEWCAPDPAEACSRGKDCDHKPTTAGCGFDKRELIQLANPAVGRRIEWETIENERVELPPEEFGRERLGWHDDPVDGNAEIDPADWEAGADTASELDGAVALSFDVRPRGTAAAITTVGRVSDTKLRGEVVEDRVGTDWLVPRMWEIARNNGICALIMDESGPAGAFKDALLTDDPERGESPLVQIPDDELVPHGKTRLVTFTGGDYSRACGALVDDIKNRRFAHYDQRPLNDAVEGARIKETLDGGWKWSRKGSNVNIAPLVAVTLARAGFVKYGHEKAAPAPWAASL